MALIKLTDRYYVGFEPMNIILKERVVVGSRDADTKNAGQERFLNISFHRDFESLVGSLINKIIVDDSSNIQQLQDIISIIESSKTEIISNLKEHINEEL